MPRDVAARRLRRDEADVNDHEAELGVVIGRRAWRVKADDSMRHVLGYTNVNDVSARDYQTREMQGMLGQVPPELKPAIELVIKRATERLEMLRAAGEEE